MYDDVLILQRQDIFKALEEDSLDAYISGMLMEAYNYSDSRMEKLASWFALEWMKGITYQQNSIEDIVAFGYYNENEMVMDFYQLQKIVKQDG